MLWIYLLNLSTFISVFVYMSVFLGNYVPLKSENHVLFKFLFLVSDLES